ncbi:MAG TPA: hypothetical protein VH008_01040 [Pseudonocardia sp.]|nr:hypothetical protein [Pseudonocardia sp.]
MLRARSRVTGVDVGVVMLANTLPRPPGDLGNARSYAYPVAFETCPGADTALVVERRAAGLLGEVAAAGTRLVGLGVRAVTTCCGFLALFQRELVERVAVPVATSSLLQVPQVLAMLPESSAVCVLTVNAATLSDEHLAAVGITAELRKRVVLAGLEHTAHFYPMILGEHRELDVAVAESEVVAAATAALADHPDIGAFVFECTNLPPYSDAVRAVTDRPVWDALTLVDWVRAGVAR